MRCVIVLLALFGWKILPVCGAYLPIIGPSPLRFQPLPAAGFAVSATPATVASPLTPPPDDSSPPANDATGSTNDVSSPVTTVVKSPGVPGAETNIIESLFPRMQPASGNELVTPQTLLQFFHQRFGDTNDLGTDVIVPMMFVPPQPAPRVSSKAVFTTP
ncbi:MAG: hypothetical protein QOF48_3824 [Verrucomicrobiota bacterium]|jgi:hypothetical protein